MSEVLEHGGPEKVFAPDRTVALLMSGGVDSTVAALLLLRAGWRVVGLTLCVPGLDGRPIETGESAARSAERLGIPHRVVRAEKFFMGRVIEPFLRAYREGRTPNPCADCNRFVKFGLLMDEAEEWVGFPVPVATGHYARVVHTPSGPRLARAQDAARDQSYFLCDVEYGRLARLFFPLGALSKAQVRALAREANLSVAESPDSMEACFLAGIDYRRFLEDTDGDVVNEKGEVLGRHRGLSRYTVGQRKGLGIAASRPLYVLKLDVTANVLVVGEREAAFSRLVRAERPNVLAPGSPKVGEEFSGKTRSRSPLAPCRIDRLDDELHVSFREAQFAPAAGQRLALYGGDLLLVSGVIL